MTLTKEELTNVLAYIEDEVHAINKIDSDVRLVINSNTLQLKTGLDIAAEKKTHATNIFKMLKFIASEMGITGNPSAFTRQEIIDLGKLER